VNKKYQKSTSDAPGAHALTVPEHVTVAMAEIVGDMRGAGLQAMSAMVEADVTGLAGVKGKHASDRVAVRHGHERGSVTLGGRRVPVDRPRVRGVDGSGELPVAAYELFSGTEILGRMAMDRMLAGLSTRRYQIGLAPVGSKSVRWRRTPAGRRCRGSS
jgi:putative transposase